MPCLLYSGRACTRSLGHLFYSARHGSDKVCTVATLPSGIAADVLRYTAPTNLPHINLRLLHFGVHVYSRMTTLFTLPLPKESTDTDQIQGKIKGGGGGIAQKQITVRYELQYPQHSSEKTKTIIHLILRSPKVPLQADGDLSFLAKMLSKRTAPAATPVLVAPSKDTSCSTNPPSLVDLVLLLLAPRSSSLRPSPFGI